MARAGRLAGPRAWPVSLKTPRRMRPAGRALGKTWVYFAATAPWRPRPQTARPGVAPVCSPSTSTGVPLTTTCFMPVAYWCGRS